MSCNLSDNLMMKHFDRELNDIESAQLKQHLKWCSECSKKFKELERIFSIVESEDLVEPPQDFEAGVMSRVSAFENKRKRRRAAGIILIYNAAIVVSTIIMVIYVLNLKGISFTQLIEQVETCIRSFFGLFAHLPGVLRSLWSLATSIAELLVRINRIIVEQYSYIIITMLAVVLSLHRAGFTLVRQGRRDDR